MLAYLYLTKLNFVSNINIIKRNFSSLTNIAPFVKDHIWQPVFGTEHRFKVYSAFVDVRNKQHPVIRLIANNINPKPDKVSCKFYYKRDKENGKFKSFQFIYNLLRVKHCSIKFCTFGRTKQNLGSGESL